MFISFEGTEGVGKSTLIQSLYQQLSQNHAVVLTREPGGTPLAEEIRALLLSPRQEQVQHDTELLLMYAARTQHLAGVIVPALSAGKVVLCDRFVDASFAYQYGGRGIDRARIQTLDRLFVSHYPDVTFWLDAPVEVGMQRAIQRGKLDRFESERLAFFQRVRDAYAQLAQKHPERIVRLDATQSAEVIAEQAYAVVMERMSV